MSIKKAISLSFLLFANMVILAHSVVFHCHSDQLLSVVCSASQGHYCDGTAHEHHSHEATNKCCTIENCQLDNLFYTEADGLKQIKPVFDTIDFCIIIFSAEQTFSTNDLTGLSFRQKPYIPLLYSEYFSQSFGLRAPPIC